MHSSWCFMTTLNVKEIEFNSIEIDNIDHKDYPDFCDAFATSATFKNGQELTESELDILNDNHSELINERVHNILF